MNSRPWCLYDWKWPDGKDGPGAYSWFHIMFLFICIVTTFLLIYFVARKHDKKKDVIICRIFGISLLTLEIIRNITNTIYVGHFEISSFPFQFCSIPIYLLAISSCFNDLNKKVVNCLIRMAAYFGLIGGISVMIYPAFTLSTPHIYYSIHTMVWHSMLVSSSLYFFFSMDLGKSLKKDLIPVSIGFIIVTFIAITLNETLYYTYYLPIGSKLNPIDVPNFFWIANNFNTEYPVLDVIKKNAPFPVFILCFIIVILLIMIIVHYIFRLIKYHSFKINYNSQK